MNGIACSSNSARSAARRLVGSGLVSSSIADESSSASAERRAVERQQRGLVRPPVSPGRYTLDNRWVLSGYSDRDADLLGDRPRPPSATSERAGLWAAPRRIRPARRAPDASGLEEPDQPRTRARRRSPTARPAAPAAALPRHRAHGRGAEGSSASAIAEVPGDGDFGPDWLVSRPASCTAASRSTADWPAR